MARRGNRADQYYAIAAFYGVELIEQLRDPNVPDFVLVHAARRAAHYALTALSLSEKRQRKAIPILAPEVWPVQQAGF